MLGPEPAQLGQQGLIRRIVRLAPQVRWAISYRAGETSAGQAPGRRSAASGETLQGRRNRVR